MTLINTIECPRWAAFPEFLEHACFTLGLDLKMKVSKGWIRETVSYRVTGEESTVMKFKRDLYLAMDDYNK